MVRARRASTPNPFLQHYLLPSPLLRMMVLLLMRMLLSRGLSYSFTHLRVHSSYSTQPSDQMSDLKV